MSTVNLNDPQVLQNFIRAQVMEGKGEYELHEEVVIFKSDDGSTFMVPGDLSVEVMAKIKAKAKKVKKVEEPKKVVEEPKKVTEEPVIVKGTTTTKK